MWHWLLFRLKKFVDRQLYGEVFLPHRVCPECGRAVIAGMKITGPAHAACV